MKKAILSLLVILMTVPSFANGTNVEDGASENPVNAVGKLYVSSDGDGAADAQRLLNTYLSYRPSLTERDKDGFTTIDYLVSAFHTHKIYERPNICFFNCPEQAPKFITKRVPLKPCLRKFDTIDEKNAEKFFLAAVKNFPSEFYGGMNCSRVRKYFRTGKDSLLKRVKKMFLSGDRHSGSGL